MCRQLDIHVAIIAVVLVVVLPAVITMHSNTVTDEGSYGLNIGRVFLGDIQVGQSVNGWFSFSDNAVASDYPPHFAICDPTGWELNNADKRNPYGVGLELRSCCFLVTSIFGAY